METLVGRSQNVNSIIQRKKKTKKIIIISIAVILITGLLLGITYNYYINKRYNHHQYLLVSQPKVYFVHHMDCTFL